MKKRFYLIDGIRGLAIVNMVLFHFLYDVFILYGRQPDWYGRTGTFLWQQGICWTFILISGLVWHLGRKGNLKRGLILNFWGLVVSVVTLIAEPQAAVWFGILNFIGCAVLLMILADRIFCKIPPVAGVIGSMILFFLFRDVQQGVLGLASHPLAVLPEWLYQSRILTPFGFPFPGFRSSDYFPMLPWFFLFSAGYFFYPILQSSRKLQDVCSVRIPLLSKLGTWSIWIYLIHQPVATGICMLLFR